MDVPATDSPVTEISTEPQQDEGDLQALVDRRAALRARMVEMRASSPEDHEGFLRTVDQLLSVANEIIDRLSGSGDRAEPTGRVEGRADEGAAGGAEDDAR